jgi:hypothetical protein
MKIRGKVLSATVFGILMMGAVSAFGQSISPTAMEFKGPRARGTFAIRNNGLAPQAVTIQAQSFAVEGGQEKVLPLDPGIEIKTKDSFTLGPQQTHLVSFDARCATLPCHFLVFAILTGPRNPNGLNVAIHLPVAVYVCEKRKSCRKNQLLEMGYRPG